VVAIEDWVVQGDKTTCRWLYEGLHRGNLGYAEAMEKTVVIAGVHVCHYRDGRISESWVTWNRVGTFEQIGETLALVPQIRPAASGSRTVYDVAPTWDVGMNTLERLGGQGGHDSALFRPASRNANARIPSDPSGRLPGANLVHPDPAAEVRDYQRRQVDAMRAFVRARRQRELQGIEG
jgi:hypothetical protein